MHRKFLLNGFKKLILGQANMLAHKEGFAWQTAAYIEHRQKGLSSRHQINPALIFLFSFRFAFLPRKEYLCGQK